MRLLRPNALFSLQHVHDAQLSPDARQIAYVLSSTADERQPERFDIVISDLVTGIGKTLAFPGGARFPRWSPDGRRLAFVGEYDGAHQLYLADPESGQRSCLTGTSAQVQGPPCWSPDGACLVYSVLKLTQTAGPRRLTQRVFRSEGIGAIDSLSFGLELADIQTGAIRPLPVGRSVALKPSFSPSGKHLLFLGADSAVGYVSLGGLRLFTYELSNGRVVEVLGDRWFIAAASWSACGQRIIIAADYGSRLSVPVTGLWIVNRDGSNPECRTSGLVGHVGLRLHHDMPTWNTSQDNAFAVANASDAYATVMRRGCAEIWRISLLGPIRCNPVVTGSRTCLILDVSVSARQLLFAVTDIHTPWELHRADLDGGGEQRLTQHNKSTLQSWPSLQLEHLEFTAPDGVLLEGWFLASSRTPGPRPTVLFIHGGPYLATGYGFRFDLHLLAANGYAVLFANFRGSAGYGEPFVRAIQGDWGERGYPDHMATVDAAIQRGLADADRLGVWGPSHGGFATCWIVGHTHRFRAAVAESAVTNYATLYYLCDAPDIFVNELGGRPHEIPDVYRARSPLSYAARCRTPTLMLHGQADVRCPIAEAEQFYRALQDVGCPTELLSIPEMTHMGDSTGPLPVRVAQNEALLDWFERYL